MDAKLYSLSARQAAALRALCKRYLRNVKNGNVREDEKALVTNVTEALAALSAPGKPSDSKGS